MKVSIAGSIACILLFACSPGVEYKTVIENKTDYDLWFVALHEDSIPNRVDSLRVPSNSQEVILETVVRGKAEDFENCEIPTLHGDTMICRIKGNDSLKLSFPFFGEGHRWSFNVLEDKLYYDECECRLTINQTDLR